MNQKSLLGIGLFQLQVLHLISIGKKEFIEDIEKNMNYNKQLIHFLQRLNRYTHREYENCIRKKINTIQVSMSYQSLDFKRKTAYICYILHIWHSFHSFRMKIFMSFACFVPDAAKQIVKMKQRYNNASVR